MSSKAASRAKGVTESGRDRELRAMLRARRLDLEARIRGRLSSVRAERAAAEHTGARDDSEVSDLDMQEDIALVLVQMTHETLDRIDAALARLHEGRYGRCLECGDDITSARLHALPFAVRCLECEDAREADASRQRGRSRGFRPGLDGAPDFE